MLDEMIESGHPADYRIKQYHGFDAPIPAVAFHPSGDFLAYTTWDNAIAFHDIRESSVTRPRLEGDSAARYVVFDAQGETLAVAWADNSIRFYGTDDFKEQRKLELPTSFWRPIAFSPDQMIVLLSGT